jgi:cyclic pyranopterin phosphate synthase
MNTETHLQSSAPRLVDRFGRRVSYLRMSVTDRCDFRCVYCMSEDMQFVPRQQVLTLEEMQQIAEVFVSLGVRKIRLTGGEPLVRSNILTLCQQLGRLDGLDELVMTTNGSQLPALAVPLRAAGVRRLNISLDSLRPDRFRELTRTGDLGRVIAGIDAARAAGFVRIKLNAVVMRGRNDDEVCDLVGFAIERGLDISFIEEMPLGAISEHDRGEAFCSSEEIRTRLSAQWTLRPVHVNQVTDGPSRYYRVAGSDIRVGFISPHSHNFCGDCNRVRLTVEGRLLLCLGNEHSVDLKAVLRAHPGQRDVLRQAIVDAMDLKPERHYFDHDDAPQIVRFMNMTGG